MCKSNSMDFHFEMKIVILKTNLKGIYHRFTLGVVLKQLNYPI